MIPLACKDLVVGVRQMRSRNTCIPSFPNACSHTTPNACEPLPAAEGAPGRETPADEASSQHPGGSRAVPNHGTLKVLHVSSVNCFGMLSRIQAYHAAFRFTGSPICQPGAGGEILLEPGQGLQSEGLETTTNVNSRK